MLHAAWRCSPEERAGEREVSLASAEGAARASEEAGYTVTQLDPADKEDLKRLIDGPSSDVCFSLFAWEIWGRRHRAGSFGNDWAPLYR